MLFKISGLAGLILLSVVSSTPPQDVTFRLLNLERRCDQLQQRVDSLERLLQNQALAQVGDPNRELMLEMQRQQLVVQQHLLTAQQQQLEMKKMLDQQALRLQELEKRVSDKPAPKATPTPTPRRP